MIQVFTLFKCKYLVGEVVLKYVYRRIQEP